MESCQDCVLTLVLALEVWDDSDDISKSTTSHPRVLFDVCLISLASFQRSTVIGTPEAPEKQPDVGRNESVGCPRAVIASTSSDGMLNTDWVNFYMYLTSISYGGFLKWGYPQIIYLKRILQYKPSSYWGTPSFGNPHM